MTEFRDDEHVIHLYAEDGGQSIDILHPESCKRESLYDDMVIQYTCGVSSMIAEWGVEYLGRDLSDGYYLAQFWATPPSWAGATPIDADAGIELTRMQLVDETGLPLPADETPRTP